MQPQAAAHVASTCQGDVPVAGMSELFIEVAPGNEIFRCADVALKAADVRPALQVVEREFGLLDTEHGIEDVFERIGELSRSCKFTDCSHAREPGCAVGKPIWFPWS